MLSRLLFHEIHDDKLLLAVEDVLFYFFCVENFVRIDIKFCGGLIWFKLESALKKKLKLSKHHISSKQAAARTAFLLIHPFPFYSVYFPSPVFVFFPTNIVREVKCASGRQYPRLYVDTGNVSAYKIERRKSFRK